MNTRKEDIKTLQEMQNIQCEIEEIDKRLLKLDESEMNPIDPYLYNTHHADDCDSEKRKKLFKVDDEYFEKIRHACHFTIIPWISIIIGIIVGVIIPAILNNTNENSDTFSEVIPIMVLSGILIGISGFIIKKVLNYSTDKHRSKMHEKERQQITNEYKIKFEQALEDDKKEKLRYENDLKIAREKRRTENQQERQELVAKKTECKVSLDKIRIISNKDIESIPALLDILESNRADNIKEALLAVDQEKRRIAFETEQEIRRKAEEDARRKAEEAARLAAMPGKVYVRIGSINTYSGNLQTVRNAIYFDGANYGFGNATGTTSFQLNPGPHNIYAQLQEIDNIYTTPTLSFTLPGNGCVYIKIILKNVRTATICLCKSMSELLEN